MFLHFFSYTEIIARTCDSNEKENSLVHEHTREHHRHTRTPTLRSDVRLGHQALEIRVSRHELDAMLALLQREHLA